MSGLNHRLAETLADIRSEHFLLNNSADEIWPTGECNCGNEWPCDAAKLLAAVEAVVAMHSPVRKGDENWNPDTMVARRVYCLGCEGEFDWPTEYKDCPTIRALESALGVSDDPQNQ